METNNFNLKDIKLLADNYSRVGTPVTLALFHTIQSFYPVGKNPENRCPIDPTEILKKLKKLGFQPKVHERAMTWLNFHREKLNRELFDVISTQGNRAELIIGSDYTFTQILKNDNTQTWPSFKSKF